MNLSMIVIWIFDTFYWDIVVLWWVEKWKMRIKDKEGCFNN